MKKEKKPTEPTEEPTEPEIIEEAEEVIEESEAEPEVETEEIENSDTIEITLESLTREIEALKGVIEELKSTPEEEPIKEIEEAEDEDEEEDEPETPEEEEDVEDEFPYPSKKDFDELKASVDSLVEKYAKVEEMEELKLAIKSKDDQINTLTKRLDVVEKIEKEPTILTEVEDETIEDDSIELVRDSIRTGVLYRDVD